MRRHLLAFYTVAKQRHNAPLTSKHFTGLKLIERFLVIEDALVDNSKLKHFSAGSTCHNCDKIEQFSTECRKTNPNSITYQ